MQLMIEYPRLNPVEGQPLKREIVFEDKVYGRLDLSDSAMPRTIWRSTRELPVEVLKSAIVESQRIQDISDRIRHSASDYISRENPQAAA